MLLFYDTETTGLPDFKAPSDASHQPHLVQLACLLTEDDGTERGSFSSIIKPDGWEIPDDVAKIHSITTEIATMCGIYPHVALRLFDDMASMASTHIAHNINFDRRIMRIAMLRRGQTREDVENLEKKVAFCTMRASMPILNLPPTDKMKARGMSSPKPPNLQEAYHHFFGKDFAGAHDAMHDVRACRDVYFAILAAKASQ